MSWTKIKDKSTVRQSLDEAGNYLFESSAKINITKDSTTAILDDRNDAPNTLILNNDISFSSRNANDEDYYGIYLYADNVKVDVGGNQTSKTPTVRSAERNTKLTVNVNTDVDELKVYGIYRGGTGTMFLIGKGNENYRQTINVSASNTAAAQAYGVYAEKGKIAYNSKLTAPVTVRATSKTGTADAYGIDAAAADGTINLNNGIAAAISAAASGAGAKAYGVKSGTGGTTVSTGLAGKVTATATATGANETDNAVAAAFYTTGAFKVTKQTTKAITAKATAKGGAASAYGIDAVGLVNLTFGLSADISGTATGKSANAYAINSGKDITISDNMAGKIIATASAKGTDDEDSATAMGLYSDSAVTIDAKITKAIAAKATSRGAGAFAYGIETSGTTITLKQGLSAAVSATASGLVAESGAIYAYTDLLIGGDVAGQVTAMATGTDSANADAFASDGGNVTFSGKITQTVIAKAASKAGVANAAGIKTTKNVVLQKGLDAGISATATGNGSETYIMEYAYCINGITGIQVDGDVAGKLNATATGKNSASAYAYGLYSDNGAIAVSGQIAKAITTKATSKQGYTVAGAILTNTTLTLGGIAADISATASGAYASANAVYGYQGIAVNGDVAGKLTAKATSTGDGKKAVAYGISSTDESGFVTVAGDITKAITVSATSKTGAAEAYGVKTTGTLTVVKNMGTVNVSASGAGTDDVATGWDVKNIVATSGELTGKATVTCKTGTATGLIAETIMGPVNAAYCTLDITVTGKDAYGIKFTGAATPTIQNSKITVKGTNSAYALYGSDERENLTVNNSTLIGDVFMGDSNDNLTLTGKSKLVGDVDMGADGTDKDAIYIYSGSQLKGDIKNTEILGLFLSDASYADAALWEGDTAEARTSAGGNMTVKLCLNLSLGEDTDHFNLIKNTGATAADWNDFDYQLSLDGATGANIITLEYGQKYTSADSAYDYELKSDRSGNTLYLAITEKASA